MKSVLCFNQKKTFPNRTVLLNTKLGHWLITNLDREHHQWITKTLFCSTGVFLGDLPSKYWPCFSLRDLKGSQHKVVWLRAVYKMMKERVKPSHVLPLLDTVVGEGGGIQWNSELVLFSAVNNQPVKFTAAEGVIRINSLSGFLRRIRGWTLMMFLIMWAKTKRYKNV